MFSRFRRHAMMKADLLLTLVTIVFLVLLVLAGGTGALTHIGATSSTTTGTPFSRPPPAATAAERLPNSGEPSCNYTISQQGTALVATGHSGSGTKTAASPDMGAFLNTLLASHETLCVAAGTYAVNTEIQISHLEGVRLNLVPGAIMEAESGNRLLLVIFSPDTVIRGGEWVGPATGVGAGIRILYASNNTVVENADISRAGWDGVFVYEYIRPSFNVSIVDNIIHDNGRYGVQVYSKTPYGMTGTVISGNVVLDNAVGGIYTNGVADVTVIQNVVRNTVGNGPGDIGIGVTNAYNDTVTLNQVDHMAWFGIQAFYNNYTVISDNISKFNAGGWDQSGITNDHSSYSILAGNVVESNGKFGIYVERSWNVTVSGNVANDNLGYGIGFYHGTMSTTGRSAIVGNACSFNSLGGIVLNSAVENVISMNRCSDNSGAGILLYNDPGQAGSTGNVISDNWLGTEGGSPQAQMFGIRETNDSSRNTLISNVMVNDTVAATLILEPGASAPP
ncbi:MAG: right-handed parallel beta-helix repeat-containing protein [Thaumarchaeota archaeon]|nr:right-handed parallel beta-helix repeat-containing protein [Nitrososphaerota archaeon]